MERVTFILTDGKEVILRPAHVDDAGQLIEGVDAVSREGRWYLRGSFGMTLDEERRYLASLDPANDAYFVATLDDQVIGWLDIHRGRRDYTRHTAEFSMGILAPYRNQRLGEAILRPALEWAKKAHVEKVCLEVRASNLGAIRLYSRLGFVEEGRRSRYVKSPEGYDDDILMSLSI